MKILTIAVPSYNVEKYLDKCLSSFIEENKLNDLEVIIVNDGSTDNTALIAKKYCTKYPDTFYLINKSNGGHGSAINAAIDIAKGKYFRVVDADDWVDTESNARIITYLRDSISDVIVNDYTNVNMITLEQFPIKNIYLEPNKIYNIDKDEVRAENLGLAQIIYKTLILQENNIRFMEKTFYEDFEYTVFPFKFISTFQYVNENIYYVLFANTNQSTSKKNMVSRLDHLERISKSLLNFLSNSNLSKYRLLHCKQKAVHLINSYLLIALIYETNITNGRLQVRKMKNYIIKNYPSFWKNIRIRYYVYFLINVLHLSSEKYEKIRDLVRGR